jgi:hypothetical protein
VSWFPTVCAAYRTTLIAEDLIDGSGGLITGLAKVRQICLIFLTATIHRRTYFRGAEETTDQHRCGFTCAWRK